MNLLKALRCYRIRDFEELLRLLELLRLPDDLLCWLLARPFCDF